MENITQWVGIDVSKATLDVYIRPMGKAFKVANTVLEISHLVEQLKLYEQSSDCTRSNRRIRNRTGNSITGGTFASGINQSTPGARFC